MATLNCSDSATAGITLVRCRLSASRPERVTIEPTHEGEVWPPRRQGVPEEGWEERQWTGIVTPERERAVGYATPAVVDDPPVRIAATAPATGRNDGAAEADDIVRALGDHAPTRDALPMPDRPIEDADEAAVPESPTLEAIAARLERAAELAETGSARSIGAVGARTAVQHHASQLAADRASLERLAARANRLAERADRIEADISGHAVSE